MDDNEVERVYAVLLPLPVKLSRVNATFKTLGISIALTSILSLSAGAVTNVSVVPEIE